MPKQSNKVNTKSVAIRVPLCLLDQIDEFAERDGSTRSAIINSSIQAYISSRKFSDLMSDLSNAIRRLRTDGNDDVETVKQIEQLLAVADVFKNFK